MSRARDKFYPEGTRARLEADIENRNQRIIHLIDRVLKEQRRNEQLKLALGLPIASLMLLVLYYFIYPL